MQDREEAFVRCRVAKGFAEKIKHLPIEGGIPYEAECFDVGCR